MQWVVNDGLRLMHMFSIHERVSPVARIVFHNRRLTLLSIEENSALQETSPAALISTLTIDSSANEDMFVQHVYLDFAKVHRTKGVPKVVREAFGVRIVLCPISAQIVLTMFDDNLATINEIDSSHRFVPAATFDPYRKLHKLTKHKAQEACRLRLKTADFVKILSQFAAAGQILQIAVLSPDSVKFAVADHLMQLVLTATLPTGFVDVLGWTGPVSVFLGLAQVDTVTKDILGSANSSIFLDLNANGRVKVQTDSESQHYRAMAIVGSAV